MKKITALLIGIIMIFSTFNITFSAEAFTPVSVSFSTGSVGELLPKNSGTAYYTSENEQSYAKYASYYGSVCAALTDTTALSSTTLHVPFTPVSQGVVTAEASVASSTFEQGLNIVSVLSKDGSEAAKCRINSGKLSLVTDGNNFNCLVPDGADFFTTTAIHSVSFTFNFNTHTVKFTADGKSVTSSFSASDVSEVVFSTNKSDVNKVIYVSSVSVYEGEPKTDTADNTKPTLYLIGDSTGSPYTSSDYYKNGGNYLIMRNGFGMAFNNYFDSEKINLVNYAVSGISSKSFLKNPHYSSLTSSWKSGDYLIIAFGHNDEKDSDEARFTNASMGAEGINTEGQFANSLYVNYIQPAQAAGVNVILATPIIRRSRNSDDVTGSDVHDLTAKGFGNYSQTIRDLAKNLNLPCIDNTQMTYNEYITLGKGSANGKDGYGIYHAQFSDAYMTTKKYFNDDDTLDENYRIDNTHLNYYGAKTVAYFMAQALKGSTEPLSGTDYAPVYNANTSNTLSSLSSYLKEYTDPRLEPFKDNTESNSADGFSIFLDTETTLHDKLGETFDVAVKVANNKGISSIGYTLSYDKDILELVAPTPTNAEKETGIINTTASAEAGRELEDGELLTYTFKVAGGGDTDIKLDINSLEYNGVSYDSNSYSTGSLNIVCDFNPEETSK